jgi:hypothetical protein
MSVFNTKYDRLTLYFPKNYVFKRKIIYNFLSNNKNFYIYKNETQINMEENTESKEQSNKPGVWTLLIGLFLIVRGVMRMADKEMEIFGILMIVVGVGSIVYYFAKK